MGSSSSKPAPSSTQHVFSADTPVRFSPDLIEALQASPESDGTRAADLELHIQRRVAAELSRLESETTDAIKKLAEEIPAPPDQTADGTDIAAKVAGVFGQKGSAENDKKRDLSRGKVQKEIDTLKQKLQNRKLRDDVIGDKDVEKAKAEVVQCLRVNDRRPLDCWQEVEAFRREVGRLEGAFLGRVME